MGGDQQGPPSCDNHAQGRVAPGGGNLLEAAPPAHAPEPDHTRLEQRDRGPAHAGALTISTTSTSALILRWYRNVCRSFFIWMLLSSTWATVKMRIRHFLHTWGGLA